MSKSRNIADLGSNDVLETDANGVTVTGGVASDTLNVDSGTLFVDGTNNRVGVGTSSPSDEIEVYANNPSIRLTDDDNDAYSRIVNVNGNLFLQADDGNTELNSSILFQLGGSEAARIDSSGNLLVGTASYTGNTTNSGAGFNNSGLLFASTANSATAILNRVSSDGEILLFRKDGADVGSIRSDLAGASALSIETSRNNLLFSNPTFDFFAGQGFISTNNSNDNSVDLGRSSARWKDLYLSGGVYLGGTGTANKLEDYEEGTWTPEYVPSSGSFAVTDYLRDGRYTKIGNTVILTFSISNNNDFDKGTASGAISLAGLPFSIRSVVNANNDNGFGALFNLFNRWDTAKSDHTMLARYNNNTSISLVAGNINTNLQDSGSKVDVGDMQTGLFVQNRIAGTIIYQTD